jgi:hypothetical protein
MTPAVESQSIPTSIPDLIDRWKSIAEFAAEIGIGYEAARKFRDRESISPVYWEPIINAAAKKGIPGIDWEWLGRVNARQKA